MENPYKELLGKPDNKASATRTNLGITFYSRGFDSERDKKFEKGLKHLTNHKSPDYCIKEFKDYYTKIITKNYLSEVVDRSFNEIYAIWINSDGKFMEAAKNYPKQRLTIYIESKPFWVIEHQLFAAGLCSPDKNNLFIRSTICYVTKAFNDIVTFDDLIRWEIGNSFGVFLGYKPKSINKEVGDRNPKLVIG